MAMAKLLRVTQQLMSQGIAESLVTLLLVLDMVLIWLWDMNLKKLVDWI